MKTIISEQPIPVAIYQGLRHATGLSPKTNEAAVTGLGNSIFSIVAQNEQGEIIGMGRIIGDGACFCQVVDIAVLPAYQGKGTGHQILQAISNFIEQRLPDGCYISLIADGKAYQLYEQFGFRDVAPGAKGMYIKK